MAQTKHFGALAAGVLVAVVLLVPMLIIVNPQPGRAALPGTNGLIAYQGIDPNGGDWEIFTLNPADFIPNLVGSQGGQLTFNNTDDRHPCYSPDGNRIGYVGHPRRDVSAIYTMPANGGTPTITPGTERYPTGCSFTGPRGTHIVYAAYDGQDWEIYTIPANGGTPTKVTDNLGDDFGPSFTAVGIRIAYLGYPSRSTQGQIYTIPADGRTPPTQLTFFTNREMGNPDFSPDGQRIVFSREVWGPHGPLGHEIFTMPANGGGTHAQLTNNTADNVDPVYSPNGQQIAYAAKGGVGDSTDYEIWMKPATGGTPFQLTINNTDDRNPSWQPQLGINEIRQVIDKVRNKREGRGTGGAETR